MFAQVSQSDVATCVDVQAARCSRLNHLLTTDSRVYVPGSGRSAGVGATRVFDRCLLNSTRLFREVSVRFGSAESARKPFFTHTRTPCPAFPPLTGFPSFRCPLLLLLPPNPVLGAAALPALQGLLHTWAAASVHQCQTHSILLLGPAPTPCRTSPLHGYWYYVSGLKGSAVG